jgi:hypothetical protein
MAGVINYHEMTMNEPRDSPARRQQFLVICTVMTATMLASIISAGGLNRVEINNHDSSSNEGGIFPGGDFVYRFTQRDYAASMSLQESVGKDLGVKPKDFDDKIYTIYLDDPHFSGLGGRELRFASGYLVTDKKTEGHIPALLLGKNREILAKPPPTEVEIRDLAATDLWPRLPYQQASLPSVNAAVVHFPFTNGFISAIILSHKIIPALRQHVVQHAQGKNQQEREQNAHVPIVISTCSVTDQMW